MRHCDASAAPQENALCEQALRDKTITGVKEQYKQRYYAMSSATMLQVVMKYYE